MINLGRQLVILFCLVAASLSFLTGCNKSPYEMAPVRGTVTVDGQPMTHGKVMFAPAAKQGELNPGKPAFGRIQSDGSFVLSTYDDDDGAVVGEHGVTVISGDDAPADKNIPKFSRLLVPHRVTVVAGQDNQIDIQLTSQEITRFATRGG